MKKNINDGIGATSVELNSQSIYEDIVKGHCSSRHLTSEIKNAYTSTLLTDIVQAAI